MQLFITNTFIITNNNTQKILKLYISSSMYIGIIFGQLRNKKTNKLFA